MCWPAGRGSRLMELTEHRAKPAVYFGGKARIIDFALSNALNSGIRRIAVATQYKAHSLIRHLQRGWNFLQPMRNESFDILPASQRVAENQWYAGTADAVFQNIDIIDSYAPEYIVMLAGDHIYKMDYERMLIQHVNEGADVTVGCIEVPVAEATGFGVMHVDEADRIIGFVEKPDASAGNAGPSRHRARQHGHLRVPARLPERPAAARRGRSAVRAAISARTSFPTSSSTARRSRIASCSPACARATRRESYWRDVGTLDAYFDANIDLTDVVPELDVYDRDWPIWTYAQDHAAGEIRARRRRPARHGRFVAGVRRLHRLRLGAAQFAALRQRARALVRRDRPRRSCCPASTSAAARACATSSSTAACASRRGLVVGEDPEVDAARFRRTERGVCLITQPMIDRLPQ